MVAITIHDDPSVNDTDSYVDDDCRKYDGDDDDY